MGRNSQLVKLGSTAALCVTAALATVACSDSPHSSATAPLSDAVTKAAATTALPKIGHVFIVALENENVLATFGPTSPAKYLTDTLVPMGTFLDQYYGIGHASLDNYTAAVSGQAPDSATSADCDIYTNFVPKGPNGGWNTTTGQIAGAGCIYPKNVWTIGNQLNAAHLTWKAYMEDMGNIPTRESAVCGHVPIGSVDITNNEQPEDQYAARHNPFVWFHSIIDGAECNNVVSLIPLETDLQSVATTPNYVWITPNVCNDGHDAPCVTGEPGGLVQANQWLRQWIPLILNSPAYKQDGLLVIITDEAEGVNRSTACCGEQPGPNEALPGGDGPGGGDVGAVMISRFITPGGFDETQYNHYSLLASVFNIFQLQKFGQHQLGYASAPGLATFGADVFTNPSGTISAQRVKLGREVGSAALLAKHGLIALH